MYEGGNESDYQDLMLDVVVADDLEAADVDMAQVYG